MRIGQLLLLAAIERQRNEEILAQDPLDDLEVLVWVVGLAQCLLARRFVRTGKHGALRHAWARSADASGSKLAVLARHRASVIDSLLLFLGTFLEEDLAQHVLLLLVRVIIFDVVVVWLVEHAVRVVIAVRVLVADSARLAQGRVGIETTEAWCTGCARSRWP